MAPLFLLGVFSARWLGAMMPTCYFHQETGLLCPGCGATRAALALREGLFARALGYNGLFVIAVTFGSVWILLSAARERYAEVKWLRPFRWRLSFLWFALILLLAFWVLRNLPGMEWMGPS